jgi:hypothetical protein
VTKIHKCVLGTHTFSFHDLLAVTQIFTPIFLVFSLFFLKLKKKGENLRCAFWHLRAHKQIKVCRANN